MSAEQILPPHPDRAEWLAARRTGIGSSDVSAILGLNKYRCPRDVFHVKRGESDDSGDWPGGAPSEQAHFGNIFEAPVREEWSRRTGIAVAAAGLHRSLEYPFMFCSPDGLTDDGGLYEGKTANQWLRGQWGDDQVPDHAELQVQHGMAVLGLPHAWVVGLIGGQELVWRAIERDDELIAMIVKAEREFWNEHVLAGVAPPLGGSEAEVAWVTDAHPVAAPGSTVVLDRFTAERLRSAYRAAKETGRVDTEPLTAAQNAIRDVMGAAETALCGDEVVATWTNNGSKFDEAAFREQCPELAADYTTKVEVIDRKRLAAEQPEQFRRFRNRVLRVKA